MRNRKLLLTSKRNNRNNENESTSNNNESSLLTTIKEKFNSTYRNIDNTITNINNNTLRGALFPIILVLGIICIHLSIQFFPPDNLNEQHIVDQPKLQEKITIQNAKQDYIVDQSKLQQKNITKVVQKQPTKEEVDKKEIKPKEEKKGLTQSSLVASITKHRNESDSSSFPELGPILKQMEDKTNIKAGQHVLDFAIIGFAKCGTSTMLYWLGQHPEIAVFPHEMLTLQRLQPWDLVKQVYEQLPHGSINYQRGYKSPNDIENVRVKNLLSNFFPQTKLIVGIRHPVLWFESFYNFRVQNGQNIAPAEELLKQRKCKKDHYFICMNRPMYHLHLARYGKTPLSEKELNVTFAPVDRQDFIDHPYKPTPNPIFIYDIQQLSDTDTKRLSTFQSGMQHFLGLKHELPPPIHFSPGNPNLTPQEQADRDARKIDICNNKYSAQREYLVQVGKSVSRWFQRYFLYSSDVTVSNLEHFQEILDSYQHDPCEQRTAKYQAHNKKK